jgi:hypothetical protein
MTCCGQPMRRDGDKYVCGKCGAWFLPGVVAVNPEYPCGCGGWHAEGEPCGGAR